METLAHRTQPSRSPDPGELRALRTALAAIRATILRRERELGDELRCVPEANQASARNLAHYVVLRDLDLRALQARLARLGLSSLGRIESHVMANIDSVLLLLRELIGDGAGAPEPERWLSAEHGQEILHWRTERLLGRKPAARSVRIMVTLPSEAAADYALVRDLVASGMNCARINCAHDGTAAWKRMIEHVRRAEKELVRSCRVLMDIPGPRLRTGSLQPGPEVRKIVPARDALGHVVRPAEVWLTRTEEPTPSPASADASIPLPALFLEGLSPGDVVELEDARGERRNLFVERAEGPDRVARLEKTAYVHTGARVRRLPADEEDAGERPVARVGSVPAVEQDLVLRPGDHLILTRTQTPGRAALLDDEGEVVEPARIPCSAPEALGWVKPGERIWFDDGRIGGVIEAVHPEGARVEITRARPTGDRLKAGKGINLPDTRLHFPALTEEDLGALPVIAAHADLIGYSFVRSADDVAELQRHLGEIGADHLGLVVKIETLAAFEELPAILFTSLRREVAGVMIARGDLAVECGFAHLAEMQEEILWLSQAAHVPVIWATQVLEQLAKHGRPSRAEVTDAAMGERAECVMLNKGPYIVEAVRALDSILRRMQRHQEKKLPLLAPAEVAERFFATRDPGEGPARLARIVG